MRSGLPFVPLLLILASSAPVGSATHYHACSGAPADYASCYVIGRYDHVAAKSCDALRLDLPDCFTWGGNSVGAARAYVDQSIVRVACFTQTAMVNWTVCINALLEN